MDFSGRLSRRDLLRWSLVTGLALPFSGGLTRLAIAAPAQAKKNVADVLRFSTRPQGWKGLFGFVTFRLHPVFVDGALAYHIRTDASDEAFARRVGLVHVPKLAGAIKADAAADYYVFTNGAAGQLPVVAAIPGRPDFTSAFRISTVTFSGASRRLTSVEQIRDAASSGRVKIAATQTVVNYPFVKWPGGELPVDRERTAYLGGGQLLSTPNPEKREVTFKLQQCFPGEWYIVTDTSAAPMAPMMRIAASPQSDLLTKAGATAKILVFGNGVKGPGPMGFQPSVVDSLPGNPVWSPFWDHFTFTWEDGKSPQVVRNQAALLQLETAGSLKRWPGTPDTKGELFVVNCPVPISAPMTWRPPS
jgi:hypothetical protein